MSKGKRLTRKDYQEAHKHYTFKRFACSGSCGIVVEALSAGDVDGDGDLDAVLANRDDVNQRFVNTSSQGGIFFGVEKTDITTETFDTRRFAVGDLNRDGIEERPPARANLVFRAERRSHGVERPAEIEAKTALPTPAFACYKPLHLRSRAIVSWLNPA